MRAWLLRRLGTTCVRGYVREQPREREWLVKHAFELPQSSFPMGDVGGIVPLGVVLEDLGSQVRILCSVDEGGRDQSEGLGQSQSREFFFTFSRTVSRNSSARMT